MQSLCEKERWESSSIETESERIEQKIKFIGRKEQLKKLKKIIDSEQLQFALIYGRRRVGKSDTNGSGKKNRADQ